jgi:hypothetical protein
MRTYTKNLDKTKLLTVKGKQAAVYLVTPPLLPKVQTIGHEL